MNRNKLPRVKARLRGLYRRVVVPATVIGIIAGVGIIGVGCSWLGRCDSIGQRVAITDRHYQDWDDSIKDKEAKLNTRQAELEAQERDLNTRIKTFEVLMMINKPGSDPSDTLKQLNLKK